MTLSVQAQPAALSRAVAALVTALLALWPMQASIAQERVGVPGTSVTLVPIKGFVPSTHFAGLVNPALQASMVIVEMPSAAHHEMSQLFADIETVRTNFAKQNISVATLERIRAADGDGVPFATGTQTTDGTSYDKWVALFKGSRTVILTIQAPTGSKLKPQDARAMASSLTIGAEATMEQKLAALPFRIRASKPFRVIDTFGGVGALMMVGPLDVDPKSEQPLLIASYQTGGQISQNQLAEAAEKLLRTLRRFENAEIVRRAPIRFAGSQGLLLSGTHEVDGARKRFVQYIAIGPNGHFVRLIASADEARFAAIEPAIGAIADSVAFADGR